MSERRRRKAKDPLVFDELPQEKKITREFIEWWAAEDGEYGAELIRALERPRCAAAVSFWGNCFEPPQTGQPPERFRHLMRGNLVYFPCRNGANPGERFCPAHGGKTRNTASAQSLQRLETLFGVIRGDDKPLAMYLASAVRNALEEFHSKYLSDAQMREINPLIRGAIYNALAARRFLFYVEGWDSLCFTVSMIPSYWEPPVLDLEINTPLPRDKREQVQDALGFLASALVRQVHPQLVRSFYARRS